MRYKSLKQCTDDLDRNSHLIRIEHEVDPHLEMAEIHRRVYRANGPAIYYANVKGSPFSAVSNLFGTLDRSRFLFRSTLKWVQRLIEVKADPPAFLRAPWKTLGIANIVFNTLPRKVRTGPPHSQPPPPQHLSPAYAETPASLHDSRLPTAHPYNSAKNTSPESTPRPQATHPLPFLLHNERTAHLLHAQLMLEMMACLFLI
jgi:hypothetical protein